MTTQAGLGLAMGAPDTPVKYAGDLEVSAFKAMLNDVLQGHPQAQPATQKSVTVETLPPGVAGVVQSFTPSDFNTRAHQQDALLAIGRRR